MLAIRLDKTRYFLACAYLLSQVYLVPVLPVGFGWPTWPALSDIVIGLLGMLVIVRPTLAGACAQNRVIWKLAILAFLGCLTSYSLALILLRDDPEVESGKTVLFGALQLGRLLQCFVLFHAAAAMNVSAARFKLLKVLSCFAFFGISAGVLLTYSGLLPTSAASMQLPNNVLMSGPWASYTSGSAHQGVGLVGYNHAYTAMQLMLAGGLALHFISQHRWLRLSIILLLLTCTFLSGSRDGFICAIILATAFEFRRRLVSFAVTAAVATMLFGYMATEDTIRDTIARQSSSASSLDEDGLSGRTSIWRERINFLNEQPMRWLVGTGFGSAAASGSNAHMLPLHVIIETGIIGLLFFSFLHYKILRAFSLHGRSGCALFWTVVVLVLSSSTQETLYPVINFPHFEGFFVFCVALGLNTSLQACKEFESPIRRGKPVLLMPVVTGVCT